jgi:hypothetical protein
LSDFFLDETRQRYGVLVDDGRPGAQSTPFDVARRQPVRVPRSEDRGQNPRRDQVRDCPPVGRRAVSSRRHHHSPTYHFPDVQGESLVKSRAKLIFDFFQFGFFRRNRPYSAPERQPLRNGYPADEAL